MYTKYQKTEVENICCRYERGNISGFKEVILKLLVKMYGTLKFEAGVTACNVYLKQRPRSRAHISDGNGFARSRGV
jgi:protein subunit release factor A